MTPKTKLVIICISFTFFSYFDDFFSIYLHTQCTYDWKSLKFHFQLNCLSFVSIYGMESFFMLWIIFHKISMSKSNQWIDLTMYNFRFSLLFLCFVKWICFMIFVFFFDYLLLRSNHLRAFSKNNKLFNSIRLM